MPKKITIESMVTLTTLSQRAKQLDDLIRMLPGYSMLNNRATVVIHGIGFTMPVDQVRIAVQTELDVIINELREAGIDLALE